MHTHAHRIRPQLQRECSPPGPTGKDRLDDFAVLTSNFSAEDHEEALKATDCHAWCRFLPLAGELEVTTICCDFFGMLRSIGDEARKCNLSVPMPGLVTSHEIDEIIDAEVPFSVVSLHATQARIVSQLQGNFHLARV